MKDSTAERIDRNAFRILMAAIILAALFSTLGCAKFDEWLIDITERERPEWVPTNAPPPSVTNAPPEQPSSADPFAGRSVRFKRIDPDVMSWAVTRRLYDVRIAGGHLLSKVDGGNWPAMSDGLQGCWVAAVEQPDGSIVVGTWDWNRASHQTKKTLENLIDDDEHSFFGLRRGSLVWFATSAPSRDARRTVRERSNFDGPHRWPHGD